MDNKKILSDEEFKQIVDFVGRDSGRILQEASSEEWDILDKLDLDLVGSYFIKGSSRMLEVVRAYIDLLRARRAQSISDFAILDFAKALADKEEDLHLDATENREVLILRMHSQVLGHGQTEAWVTTTVLERVARRNQDKLCTIILSERNFPNFETSGLFKILEMGNLDSERKSNYADSDKVIKDDPSIKYIE